MLCGDACSLAVLQSSQFPCSMVPNVPTVEQKNKMLPQTANTTGRDVDGVIYWSLQKDDCKYFREDHQDMQILSV